MCCPALSAGAAVAAGAPVLHVHGHATSIQGTAAACGGACADGVRRYTVMLRYTVVHISTVQCRTVQDTVHVRNILVVSWDSAQFSMSSGSCYCIASGACKHSCSSIRLSVTLLSQLYMLGTMSDMLTLWNKLSGPCAGYLSAPISRDCTLLQFVRDLSTKTGVTSSICLCDAAVVLQTERGGRRSLEHLVLCFTSVGCVWHKYTREQPVFSLWSKP